MVEVLSAEELTVRVCSLRAAGGAYAYIAGWVEVMNRPYVEGGV